MCWLTSIHSSRKSRTSGMPNRCFSLQPSRNDEKGGPVTKIASCGCICSVAAACRKADRFHRTCGSGCSNCMPSRRIMLRIVTRPGAPVPANCFFIPYPGSQVLARTISVCAPRSPARSESCTGTEGLATVRTVGCQPKSDKYFVNLTARCTPPPPVGGNA